ncbi:MAG TPA: peptide-methionine (S)-S-oxide reductase MsrA [Nitrososphaeraceae archaeon]|nr:peptide-methionine (S)-S-oxide reductase MsrA [Nitrososphaeraceae archaeon]
MLQSPYLTMNNSNNKATQIATFANGCFWCTEAVFKRLKGVKSVLPGYSGGVVENPSYDEVCTGKTGHAESIQIEFDPTVISYEKILDIFWHTHDPTTLNRQGNDVGTQYRSAIFYHDQKQKEIAEMSKRDLEKTGVYKNPIVTEITPFKNFYIAEDYHKDYYEKHQDAPYCSFVINPKVHKLIQKYGNDLEDRYK